MNKNLALLFLIVLMDLVGFGMVLPLLPFFADKFDASGFVVGCLFGIYSLLQFVFSPLWGSWSDRIGRKPILLLSTAGSCVAYLVFAHASTLGWLFVSRGLAGISAGNIAAAQAYIADSTTPDKRAKGMGLLGAAFGIGFMAGPALAAVLMHFSEGAEAYVLPGYVAAGLSFMSFVGALLFLPESRTPGAVAATMGLRERVTGIARIARSAFSKHPGKADLLFASSFLLSFVQSSLYAAFPLLCKLKWGWDARHIGYAYMAMGLVTVFVQGGLIRQLVKRFSESTLFFGGSILTTVGLAAMPFAPGETSLLMSMSVMALGIGMTSPTLMSLVSKEAKAGAYGTALGLSQGLAGLGRVAGPAWGGWLYGFVFYLPFVLTAFVAAVLCEVARKILLKKI